MLRRICILISLLIMASPAVAIPKELSVACAANFTGAMKEIAALFEAETGTDIILSFGSTGMLYGQIVKGAPYDLFLSADAKRPRMLADAARAETPVTYAVGKAVLWTADTSFGKYDSWRDALKDPAMTTLGISTPKVAPYGASAMGALEDTGLAAEVAPKLVYGKSVAQAFQFAATGNADASFAALSLALSGKGPEGMWWEIPEAEPVRQDACVLTDAANAPEARRFLAFINGPSAKTVKDRYGYE